MANAATQSALAQHASSVIFKERYRTPDSCIVHTLDVGGIHVKEIAERKTLRRVSSISDKYSGVQLEENMFARLRCLSTLVDGLANTKTCFQNRVR